jgi:hypothetical protein
VKLIGYGGKRSAKENSLRTSTSSKHIAGIVCELIGESGLRKCATREGKRTMTLTEIFLLIIVCVLIEILNKGENR